MEWAPSSVKIRQTKDFPEAIPPVSPIFSIVPLEAGSKAAKELANYTDKSLAATSLLLLLLYPRVFAKSAAAALCDLASCLTRVITLPLDAPAAALRL